MINLKTCWYLSQFHAFFSNRGNSLQRLTLQLQQDIWLQNLFFQAYCLLSMGFINIKPLSLIKHHILVASFVNLNINTTNLRTTCEKPWWNPHIHLWNSTSSFWSTSVLNVSRHWQSPCTSATLLLWIKGFIFWLWLPIFVVFFSRKVETFSQAQLMPKCGQVLFPIKGRINIQVHWV